MKPRRAFFLTAALILGIILISLLRQFSGFDIIKYSGAPKYEDVWWNASWHYRMKIEISTENFSRTNWPVERQLNFTWILNNVSVSGTFDANSTRVVEYNSSGSILQEIPSQFDLGSDFNASSNANGELVFILNGSNPENTTRYFYVYFDIIQNGNKTPGNYQTQLNYTWDNISGEAQINNSKFIVYIDTTRGDNSSGIYRVWDVAGESNWFFPAGDSDPTIEYTQITNGTENLTFDLRNNATFTAGPVRIRMRQTGEEIIWNQSSSKTNQTLVVKDYYFYPNSSWLKVMHNITNTDSSSVNRSSSAGISAFDVARAYQSTYKVTGNESNPGSWIRGTYSGGGPLTGFIHINQSQDVFYATNITSPNRIGIKMNTTNIESNTSVVNIFAMVFGHTVSTPSIMEDTKDRLINEVNMTQWLPAEKWVVSSHPNTSHTIYNRNESIFITGNVTFDPWNLTQKVNATLDMGTPSGADDQAIDLNYNATYGNQTSGYKLFTNYFNLTNTSEAGYWNITIKAYDSSGYYINESYYIFNVTAEYFVNLTILNALGLPDRIVYANIDVKNFRQDTWMPGASINCSYGGIPVTNITGNGNGTYSANFTSPSTYGLYTLNCSVSKDGNFGYDTDNFTVEAAKTNVSISRTPAQYTASNVTLYNSETFTINITLTNEGNSSAYATNITLSLPQNWTANPPNGSCGNIPISSSCLKSINVTIPANSTPGNYAVNITANWTNLDNSTSYNSTYINVTVSSHPLLEVPQAYMETIIGPGNATVIGNFTVNSTGNSPLSSITFSVTGLSDFAIGFTPPGISSLAIGQSQPVQVNVTSYSNQSPGIYTGIINVSSSNNGFDLINLTIIVTGTNMSLERQPQNFTANVTFYQNDSFVLHAEANNTGNVTAFYASINISIPQNWTANVSSYSCGNISKSGNCTGDFMITVVKGTPSGSYLVNVTVNWQDIGIGLRSNNTFVNVTVLSNRILVVLQDQITDNVSHGTEKIIGYLTLNSTGNDPLSNVLFTVSGFTGITIKFNPPNLTSLAAGAVQNVLVNATVPLGYDTGTYNGTVNVTTSNDGYKVVNISITVPQNGSWIMSSTYCEKVQTPDVGYVCNVTVNNTGNLPLNFSITPATSNSSMSNYSWTNVTNFTVNKQESYVFAALYNVTGVAGQNWKISNYTIDPQESYASPNYMILVIALNPNLTPLVTISVTPTKAEQTSYFIIYSNATSQSGLGISYVSVNVTRPNGTADRINMSQLYWSICAIQGKTCWYANYSDGAWGQTVLKGNYSVIVTAFDNSLTNETNSTSFQVYTKLLINFTTGVSQYIQGDTGSIYYRSRDYNYTSLSGVNTTITISNPNGTTHGIIFTNGNYTTGSDGWAVQFPTFILTSDAVLGNYTSNAFSTYYDSNAPVWVNSSNQMQFQVTQRTSEGLFADLETTVVWYPNGIMKFGVLVYDSNGQPADPDQLNLTVYDPADNVYFSVRLSNFTKRYIGYYTYQFAMPGNTPTGMFMGVLNVSKGTLKTQKLKAFRVAQGGPYDVRLRILDNEVPRGDFLDFELIVENMGEAGQDVDIDYWVSDGTQTWYSTSEAAYTPPQNNLTLLRSAYIFSNQNLGMHTLNVMVNYSYLNPPITKNATFMVTEGGVQPPQPPGPGAPPGEAPAGPGGAGPEIKITEYPDELGVEAGVSRIVNIKIKNVGGDDANNISISISGIDASWFELGYSLIAKLKPNETNIIPLQIIVPSGTKSGEFIVKIKAEATGTKDQKIFKLRIFTSKKELIEFELARLKAKTEELEMKANQIKNEFDVEEVFKLIDQIRKRINESEGYLSDQKYDAALGSIYAGWELYNRAAYLLETAAPKKPFEIPWWLVLIILVLLGIVIFLMVVLRKLSLNIKVLLRGRYTEAKTIAGIVKKVPVVDDLRAEKEKIERMLSLLETQYKQGIISKEAYDGLRTSSEQKLKNLNDRIRKELKV
ncbi:MAG: NEW3 domain-containing protein [Candidatus Aenigmarchaeota archaeon]|nr:NEW3 domain-containing protein [Candidatus Aenigmarchaeota archaeon]